MIGENCMQEQKRLVSNKVDRTLNELTSYINYLYSPRCPYLRFTILNQLKCKIQELQVIKSLVYAEDYQIPLESPQNLSTQRTFTLEELAKYNGKNGNPAYAAVNGTVYDVTNNATWAAATHFGLSAGNDLTNAFASCHAGQPVLNKLKVVGKLYDERVERPLSGV